MLEYLLRINPHRYSDERAFPQETPAPAGATAGEAERGPEAGPTAGNPATCPSERLLQARVEIAGRGGRHGLQL